MISIEKLSEYFALAGLALVSLDEDDVEVDDVIGHLLYYGAEAANAIQNDLDLPPVPVVEAQMLTGKLSSKAKMVVFGVRFSLLFAQSQFIARSNPKAAAICKYVGQALSSVMMSGILPPPPPILIPVSQEAG